MAVFSTATTASHAYYARRSKSEIWLAIANLRRAAGLEPIAENRSQSRGDLASECMRLHGLLPDE